MAAPTRATTPEATTARMEDAPAYRLGAALFHLRELVETARDVAPGARPRLDRAIAYAQEFLALEAAR